MTPEGEPPLQESPAPPPPPEADPDEVPDVVSVAAIGAHAEPRKRHRAEALEWSAECEQAARRQAEVCAAKGAMEHGNKEGMGQNIYYTKGTVELSDDQLVQKAVDAWYADLHKPGWRPGKGFTPGTGHFTQLVWRGTTHCGTAIARSGDKKFVVTNYFPPGNVRGRFDENVRV